MQEINIAAIKGGKAFVDLSRSPLSVGDAIISSPVPNARNGLAVSVGGKPGKQKPRPEGGDTKSKGPDTPRKRQRKAGGGGSPKKAQQDGQS